MKTVKQAFLNRLVAQAEEAEIQGLTKIAESLTDQVSKLADNVRADDAFYVYSSKEFKQDISGKLWDAIIRIADFYDSHLDAVEMQTIVDKYASDMIDEIRVKLGVKHGVGAYEPSVPGEVTERVTIELEDKE